MTSPVSPSETIAKAMEGDMSQPLNAVDRLRMMVGGVTTHNFDMHDAGWVLDAFDTLLPLARKAEALARENAEKDERIAALEAGLELFAREAEAWTNFSDEEPLTDPFNDGNEPMLTTLRVVDLRRARTLIQGEKK